MPCITMSFPEPDDFQKETEKDDLNYEVHDNLEQ
jgi:hypothetical protein